LKQIFFFPEATRRLSPDDDFGLALKRHGVRVSDTFTTNSSWEERQVVDKLVR
jgi:hypothetical protein